MSMVPLGERQSNRRPDAEAQMAAEDACSLNSRLQPSFRVGGGGNEAWTFPSMNYVKRQVKRKARQRLAELKLQETRMVSLQVSPHVVP